MCVQTFTLFFFLTFYKFLRTPAIPSYPGYPFVPRLSLRTPAIPSYPGYPFVPGYPVVPRLFLRTPAIPSYPIGVYYWEVLIDAQWDPGCSDGSVRVGLVLGNPDPEGMTSLAPLL